MTQAAVCFVVMKNITVSSHFVAHEKLCVADSLQGDEEIVLYL